MTHGWTLYPDFDVTGGFLSLFLNLIITVTYRLPATLIDSKPGVKETLFLFLLFLLVRRRKARLAFRSQKCRRRGKAELRKRVATTVRLGKVTKNVQMFQVCAMT